MPSYADEEGVDPGRRTETLAEMDLEVASRRWSGVVAALRRPSRGVRQTRPRRGRGASRVTDQSLKGGSMPHRAEPVRFGRVLAGQVSATEAALRAALSMVR